jgi:hypothetical protein
VNGKKSCIETSIGISQLYKIWDTAYCEYLSNRVNVNPFLLHSKILHCESLSRYYLTLKLHEQNKLGLYRTKREVK